MRAFHQEFWHLQVSGHSAGLSYARFAAASLPAKLETRPNAGHQAPDLNVPCAPGASAYEQDNGGKAEASRWRTRMPFARFWRVCTMLGHAVTAKPTRRALPKKSDYITFNGMHLRGRAENAKLHTALFRRVLKGTTLSAEIESIKLLSGSVALGSHRSERAQEVLSVLCPGEIRFRLADSIVSEYARAAIQCSDHALGCKTERAKARFRLLFVIVRRTAITSVRLLSDHGLARDAAAIHLKVEIDHRRAGKMPGQPRTRRRGGPVHRPSRDESRARYRPAPRWCLSSRTRTRRDALPWRRR